MEHLPYTVIVRAGKLKQLYRLCYAVLRVRYCKVIMFTSRVPVQRKINWDRIMKVSNNMEMEYYACIVFPSILLLFILHIACRAGELEYQQVYFSWLCCRASPDWHDNMRQWNIALSINKTSVCVSFFIFCMRVCVCVSLLLGGVYDYKCVCSLPPLSLLGKGPSLLSRTQREREGLWRIGFVTVLIVVCESSDWVILSVPDSEGNRVWGHGGSQLVREQTDCVVPRVYTNKHISSQDWEQRRHCMSLWTWITAMGEIVHSSWRCDPLASVDRFLSWSHLVLWSTVLFFLPFFFTCSSPPLSYPLS